jgi:trans-aconitate 2-methyltransferase
VHLLRADHLTSAGGEHPVLRWMEGTALRPVRASLDGTLWESFRAELSARLAAVYPARSGHVAFPFRRIFVVARKA